MVRAANIFNIDRGGDNFHIVQRELTTLSNNIAVDDNHRTSIVVKPVTIAALLVCIHVDTTALQDVSMKPDAQKSIHTSFVACEMRFTRVFSFLSS